MYGKGAKRAIPEKNVLLSHLAKKISVLLASEEPIRQKLSANDQLDLLFEMELPLANVLAKMEIAGISVRKETLQDMERANEIELQALTQEIYDLAGEAFNINSPKQLGVILFEKLGLPLSATKKTKTGYSTAVDVLERLAHRSPIVAKILEYRQIAKLQSTYIIGLQDSISFDGKIHTRYLQDLTQTGRLSSVDPNLQNIPVRLEQGRLIRKAFVPEWKESVLLSSDYSQIELRVLAHISGDEHLIAAFKEGDQKTSLLMTAAMLRLLTLVWFMAFLILVWLIIWVLAAKPLRITLKPILNVIRELKIIWIEWCEKRVIRVMLKRSFIAAVNYRISIHAISIFGLLRSEQLLTRLFRVAPLILLKWT